jgi:hypothetical protein
MKLKNLVALCGSTVLPALSAATALAAGPAVSVRVEGLTRTLKLPTLVHTRRGSITRYGAPKGSCPARSAMGALDAATRHRWKGTWSKSFDDYEITSILGETHSFSSKNYWEIFVGDVAASTGACEIKVHAGEQLLFAAVPLTGTEYPLGLSAAHSVVGGKSFRVKVVWFDAAGKARPLAGARVIGSGIRAVTNKNGIATVTARHRGTLVLHADRKGYIRAAPVAVLVA